MGKRKETIDSNVINGKEESKGISRRDFVRMGVGATALGIGAVGMIGKVPFILDDSKPAPSTPLVVPDSSEPIVAMVKGDSVTVMQGQSSVKVKDAVLASMIAGKVSGS